MQDLLTRITQIRRPALLLRAARFGLRDYHRDRHLHRLLGPGHLPRPALAALRLSEDEAALDQARRHRDPVYSLVRHLDVLIALLGEVQLLQAPNPDANPNSCPDPCPDVQRVAPEGATPQKTIGPNDAGPARP